MKNLNELAEKIWEEKSLLKKRELLHELIDYSDAKRKTKILSHRQVDIMADHKLDYFAANYKLSGEKNKVIK